MVNGAKTDQIAAISAKSFPASSLQTGTGVSDFAQTAAVQACIVVPWGAWDRLALLETPRARIPLHSSRIWLFLSHPTLSSQATSGAGVSCRRGGRRSSDGHNRPSAQVGAAGHTRR